MNAGHAIDHEKMSDGRRIGRLLSCRVRREDGGCPCTHYCEADVENGCLPVRVAEPIGGWTNFVNWRLGL